MNNFLFYGKIITTTSEMSKKGVDLEYFALSVIYLRTKKNASGIDASTYEPFFKNLYIHARKVFMLAELSRRNILHYHGVIHLPIGFFKRRLVVKGFHFKIETIWNMRGWLTYVYKDYQLEDYTDTISLICHEKLSYLPQNYPKKKRKRKKSRLAPLSESLFILDKAEAKEILMKKMQDLDIDAEILKLKSKLDNS